jgi:hypothetical protein
MSLPIGDAPLSDRCPACGAEEPGHELGSAQVWDGGIRLVCQHVLCQMCRRTTPQFRVAAVLDRVPVCEHCLPLRRAVLARMAAARRAAGTALSAADRRALSETGR